jgi:hypothetical protein
LAVTPQISGTIRETCANQIDSRMHALKASVRDRPTARHCR